MAIPTSFAGVCRAYAAMVVRGLSVAATSFVLIAAAEEPPPKTGVAKVAAKAPPEKAKSGTLTVNVLASEPDVQQHVPVPKAMVRIGGSDDTHETDDKGRVKLTGVAIGKAPLQIMVTGAPTCRLPDIIVVAGEQAVTVLINKKAMGLCKRLK